MTKKLKEAYVSPIAEELTVEYATSILESSSLENPVDGGEWVWE